MLDMGFVKEDKKEDAKKVWLAATYRKNELLVAVAEDAIASINQKLQKKDLTAEKKAALKQEKDDLEKSIEGYNKLKAAYADVYAMVLADFVSAGNDEKVVDRVLGIIASEGDKKMIQHACDNVPGEILEALYRALMTIHVTSPATESGMASATKEVKDAIKKAQSEVESIIKEQFSIQHETDYTTAVKCKINKTDLRAIHETFVTGLKLKVDVSEPSIIDTESSVRVTGLQFRTAGSVKVKRDGTKEYKFKTLLTNLGMIALTKYSK